MKTFQQELEALLLRRVELALLCRDPAPRATTVEILPTERFTVDAGMVTDNRTGLTWSQENVPGGQMNWKKAAEACTGLTLGGLSDWRLPSIRELLTIVDYERHEPAIDPLFTCDSTYYWSSTPAANSPGVFAWAVYFYGGYAYWGYQSYDYRVRAVRSSQSFDLWHVR